MRRSGQICECKIVDTALSGSKHVSHHNLWVSERVSGYLGQQLPEHHEETHEIPGIIGNNIGIVATYIFCSCMHCRLHRLSGCIHEQLGKPLKDHLDLLGVGLGQVGQGERDSNIVDTSCNFFIRLYRVSMRRCASIQKLLTRRIRASFSSSFLRPRFWCWVPWNCELMRLLYPIAIELRDIISWKPVNQARGAVAK